MEKIKIAVLGAGYGGVHAAKALHKKFKKDLRVEITVYDKNPFHTLMTELHEVAGGRCEPDSVRISLEKIFGGKRVNVIVDKITDIDFEKKTMRSQLSHYDYDYLILGVGAEPEFFGIPGAAENTFSLWSYDDAVLLRDHITAQFLKASREPDEQRRRAILTFTVAGAGFTGIEMYGELLDWKSALCREYHVDEEEVTILNVEAMAEILPTLPKKLREKSLQYIAKKGGQVRLNTAITEVKPEGFSVKNGEFIPCETLIWTCGVRGAAFAGNLDFSAGKTTSKPAETEADHNLRFNIKKKARLASNEYMQSVDFDHVYIVGDVLWFHDKQHVLPQVVETALHTAEVAAHNISVEITGGNKKTFHSHYHGTLVSIGGKFAAAYAMGITMSGAFAMVMKNLVNIHYLWEVAGFNTCWGYLQHHFFNIKHDRSVIGSHGAAKSPLYWILPLRMFLGGMWILEGVNKILDGWLTPGVDKVGWMFTNSPDSLSGATMIAHTAVKSTGGAFELHQPILSQPFFLFQSFMDTFVAWVPHWMIQYGITFAEIGLGLALLGGLFTLLAADASFILCVVLILGGMFKWDQTWLMVAAIAVKGGAGKILGLDYWVMPALQKWWNSTKLAKKTYLYIDEPVRKKTKKS